MGLIKESYKLLKENFIILFLLDLFFTLTLLLFSYFSMKKISFYILEISNANPQLLDIQSQLTGNLTNYNSTILSSTLSSVQSAVDGLYNLQYFIIPISLFLIWTIFQGLIYYFIEKTNFLNFTKKFILITISVYIIFLTLIILSSDELLLLLQSIARLSIESSFALIMYLILFLILFYVTTIFYSSIPDISKSIKNMLSLKTILLFIQYLIIIIIYATLFILSFIYLLTDTKPYFMLIPISITIIIALFYKILIFKSLNKE